ncbi:SDR family oxidoreductase [Pseudonocardia kunmingensis]|uniref:SDR family oxidoreductase n=1 Tax=Pseudonocardia kunmingensis TaxID=630975 RepID=UPI00114FFC53|nr:SDR family oxidoreductase [Pseudonocardia kunmingensis]
MDLSGKGVVVTGAGRGIGRAIADLFATRGARVVVNDLDAEAAGSVAREVGGHAVPGDAASEAGVEALIAAARDAVGEVDVFCANAGIAGAGDVTTGEDRWAEMLDVNVMAHVRAARLLVPGWVERGDGRFVVTASAAGLLTSLGSVQYAVTKHAAVAFAEWLAATYGDRGLAVHCICPQGVNTRMLANAGSRRGILTRDTALEPEQVAGALWDAMTAGEFLVLPHPQVRDYTVRRAAEHERWLAGMRKLQRRLDHPDPEEQ